MSSRCTTTCDRRFRLSGACILIAILVGSTQLLANQVDFSLITEKGWVQFTVGGDWKILTMDTKNPVRGAVFQIPNPADGGGPAPTNAVVMLFELDSAQAAARYAGLRQEYTKVRNRESESGKSSKMNSKREIRGTRGKWRIVTLPTCISVSRLHGRICRKMRLVTTPKRRRPLSAC